MQLLLTSSRSAQVRVLQVNRWQLLLWALGLTALVLAFSGSMYHLVFLKAAREGWPVVSPLVRLIVRDEVAQRDLFMRENLDAMAQRLGEIQAKLVRLEAMGDRVAGLANMKPEDIKPLRRGAVDAGGEPTAAAAQAVGQDAGRAGGQASDRANGKASDKASDKAGDKATHKSGEKSSAFNPDMGGKGGPYLRLSEPSLAQLQASMRLLDQSADFNIDLYTLFESRLLQSRLVALMIPSQAPLDSPPTSGFGFRSDPFTGLPALHTGLDFPAEPGTPIHAAAGGIVVRSDNHPAYGQLLEIDHGNGVVTRYAHCSSIEVVVGALVRRGQMVARVGNSGRSTGPHLHFEVLVEGVPHDPARFLARAPPVALPEFAARPARR